MSVRAALLLAAALTTLALATLAAACGSAPSTATPEAGPGAASAAVPSATGTGPPAGPASATVEPSAPPALGPVALEAVFGGRQFNRPVELGAYPDGRVFVADQNGVVLLLALDGTEATILLDLRGRVQRAGNEEGLLSVALDPDFQRNGHLFAYYSAVGRSRTVLSRFTVEDGAALLASELLVLEVLQPFPNHNGGAVRFGPDGMLYLGLGDGGHAGDPLGSGQNPSTLLGSIIRIDVREASAERPYAIPADNPELAAGARPEVWAYGFRNPWRMAFDAVTGTLWAADVGQDREEEIDAVQAGGNHGWNRLEGNRCYEPAEGCDAAEMVPPVATYGRDEGCSVTGGTVYRGAAVPAIAGAYLFGDFCTGTVWALPAEAASGGATQAVVVAESGRAISSFGVDGDGELYVLVFNGPILRVIAAR